MDLDLSHMKELNELSDIIESESKRLGIKVLYTIQCGDYFICNLHYPKTPEEMRPDYSDEE